MILFSVDSDKMFNAMLQFLLLHLSLLQNEECQRLKGLSSGQILSDFLYLWLEQDFKGWKLNVQGTLVCGENFEITSLSF